MPIYVGVVNIIVKLLQRHTRESYKYDLHSRSRARSIGLIRIRRTPPFSDEAFDWAHPNPDESSELIRNIHG